MPGPCGQQYFLTKIIKNSGILWHLEVWGNISYNKIIKIVGSRGTLPCVKKHFLDRVCSTIEMKLKLKLMLFRFASIFSLEELIWVHAVYNIDQ